MLPNVAKNVQAVLAGWALCFFVNGKEDTTRMFVPRVKSPQTDLLMKAVLSLENEEDAYRFFEDVCTVAELKSMAQRLEVAILLRQGVTYQEIVKRTGASSTTISRVNRALLYGAEGYHRVLDCLEQENALPLAAEEK